MKFFTPDLLLQFGSDDAAVADAAQERWEKADARYQAHLAKIRPLLPRGVRSFLRRPCLHDAPLRMAGLRHDLGALQMIVEPESGHAVALDYDLCERPVLVRHAALVEADTPIVWLYDEFAATRRSFTHSILFTSGWELQLRFASLKSRDIGRIVLAAAGVHEGLDTLLVG